jgi:L-ascorbate metabolism protein UlaG (beta-lactamase superfamily)
MFKIKMKKKILTLALAAATLGSAHAEQKTDEFTTHNGKTVKITNIKHASIQIDYDGKMIYIDPVGDGVKPATNFTNYPKADFIFVTHEHADHFDLAAIGCLREVGSTMVYLNKNCFDQFHNGIVMANGDSLTISEDFTIKAVPAYNTTEGREKFHPKGRDNGYVLNLDGLRIYIAGDTEDIPEMAGLGPVDIAFLPCNQPYTMTVDQLVNAARTLKPRVLYPYHYSSTPILQARMKLMNSGIDVRIRDYQ